MLLEHDHDWEPIPGWPNRFECLDCNALGYRRMVQGSRVSGNSNEIVAYKCKTSGCNELAVVRDPQRCKAHFVRDGDEL